MKMAFEYCGGSLKRLPILNALRAEGFEATGTTGPCTEGQQYIIVETAPGGHGYERVEAIIEANRLPEPARTHE